MKALVTGASSGIGRDMARELSKKGYDLVLVSRDEDKLKKLKEELEENKTEIEVIAMDLSVEENCKKLHKKVDNIDILINNAGITKDGLMLRMKENDFDAVIDVNLKGTWNCMKHATKLMMKQKYGRIVSMSSVVGVMGNAGQVNYAASKSGIIGMTMSLAREVGSRGITVNAVAPGFIQTAMTDVLSDDIKEQMKSQIPLGAFGSVQDIANAVVFLASDEAKYITGQTLHVDGGMAM